jgi:hypothetical protein
MIRVANNGEGRIESVNQDLNITNMQNRCREWNWKK